MKILARWTLCVLLAAAFARPACADGPLLGSDPNWALPAFGGALALGFFDSDLRNDMLKAKNGGLGNFLGQGFGAKGSLIIRMGQPEGVAAVAAGFYGTGALLKSTPAKRTGVELVESYAVQGVSVLILKHIIGRYRPYNGGEAGHFAPFSSNDSFPSGHSSTAFAAASVISYEYPSIWVGVLAYGTAATVGFVRVYQDQHWASDVAAGAILGIVAGRAVARWEDSSGWAKRFYSDGRGLYYKQAF